MHGDEVFSFFFVVIIVFRVAPGICNKQYHLVVVAFLVIGNHDDGEYHASLGLNIDIICIIITPYVLYTYAMYSHDALVYYFMINRIIAIRGVKTRVWGYGCL